MLLSGSAGAGLIAFLGKLFLTNLFGRLEEMVKAVQVMSNDMAAIKASVGMYTNSVGDIEKRLLELTQRIAVLETKADRNDREY